jgi:dTDP-4-amino-4,6-dideoxygalactose transaminase
VYDALFEFEDRLARFTGAPFAVATDGCTHALELCFRYQIIKHCQFTAYTYLSVPQTLRNLYIDFDLIEELWTGEYQFHKTNIWDSARLLRQGMYRPGQMQCLSFGNGKPLQPGRVGAVLTDDAEAYRVLSQWRSDGRDLHVSPWSSVKRYGPGWHYCPTLEDCAKGIEKLALVNQEPKYIQYPDLRTIDFKFA